MPSEELTAPPAIDGVYITGPDLEALSLDELAQRKQALQPTEHRNVDPDLAAVTKMAYTAARAVVEGAALSQENKQLQQSLNEARDDAGKDTLTGLPNRRAFMESLEESIAKQEPFGIFALDLNGFKKVNDTYGHAEGDALLTLFGQRFSQSLRTSDAVTAELSRPGGDEFFVKVDLAAPPRAPLDTNAAVSPKPVIQLSAGDRMQAVETHLKEVIADINANNERYADFGSSFGCAIWHPGDDVNEVLQLADENLYKHKAASKEPTPLQ